MPRFTTRVELHGADSEDYDTLHDAMRDEGFSKTITDSSTGQEFELPEAEYNIEGDFKKQQVLEKAKNAVAETGLESSILVTKSGGRIWHNLNEVD
jgi:hypothetical protein